MEVKRLETLDYLRGLAAFCIMLYHYLWWAFVPYSSESFFGRVGIYGVSVFYVLSGLTLFYVYHRRMKINTVDLRDFYIKRIFRIFPLLWLCTFATLVLRKSIPEIDIFLLNVSGLFSIYKIDSYIAVGAWSIGNELTFYLLFPLLIYFLHKPKWQLVAIILFAFSLYIFFAFFALSPSVSIQKQWIMYINPFNQAFLFIGGFIIGLVFIEREYNQYGILSLLILSLLGFILYPVDGDPINLITGYNRLYFSLICFIICFAFLKLKIALPGFVHLIFKKLGEISYSLYLLHPIVWNALVYLNLHFLNLSPVESLWVASIISLLLSIVTYEYFEKFFMSLGKRVFSVLPTAKVRV